TLMRWEWEPELLAVGHDAGLRAIGRDPVPALTERFRDSYLPLLWVPGTLEEVEYPGLIRRLLADEGIHVSDGELERFLQAEHAAWQPARMLASTTHALLETPRARPQGRARVERARSSAPAPSRSRADGRRGAPRRGGVLVRGRLAQTAPGHLRACARRARRGAVRDALRRRHACDRHRRRRV